jgi:hypothetical protein
MARRFGFPAIAMRPLARRIVSGQGSRQHESWHARKIVPPVLYLRALAAVGTTVGFLTIIIVALVRLAIPFPDHTDLFSGWLEFSETILAYSEISCSAGFGDDGSGHCYFNPDNWAIAQVDYRMVHGKVSQTRLNLRAGALALGDLIALWGRPETEPFGASTRFWWPLRRVSATSAQAAWPPSYRASITSVILVGDG